MRQTVLLSIMFLVSACSLFTKKPVSGGESAGEETTVDFYHGDRVSDPYRWLEEDGTPNTDEWLAKQEQKVLAYWKSSSALSKIKDRLIAVEKQQSPSYAQPIWAKNGLFVLKFVPPKNQPILVKLPMWDRQDQETVIVDPNVIDSTGMTAIDWAVPSHDGSMVAVSMSKNDAEMGSLYIYEVEKGAASLKAASKKAKTKTPKKSQVTAASDTSTEPFPKVDDVITGVHRALGGGSLAWTGDDTGFYYTKYPEEDGETASLGEQVYFHKIGTASRNDERDFGNQLERTARIQLTSDPRSNRVLATVQKGAMPKFSHFLRDPEGDWQKLADFGDGIDSVVFAPEGGFFMIAHQDAARGKVLFLSSPKIPLSQARRLIPETNDTIVTGTLGNRKFLVTSTRFYVSYLTTAGTYELRSYSHDGKPADTLAVSNAAPGEDVTQMDREEILIPYHSFAAQDAWYRYDGQIGKMSFLKTKLSIQGAEMGDVQITRVEAQAKDGAQLPITLIHQGALNKTGNRPTLMIADGGFGRILMPRYSLMNRFFIEQGGILAVATVRGGGELGENWHTAGNLVHKQNTFGDLFACASFLISEKYTSPDKLAFRGVDSGGLIGGVMMTQHPDAFGAVIAESGVYDMMRSEFTEAGEGAVEELGTNSEEAQYRAMIAYSPYHHVPARTAFPPALFIVGKNDRTVSPWHSRKMVARLQAENTTGGPILFWSAADTGHRKNIPYLKKLDETAQSLAFLFKSLKMSF